MSITKKIYGKTKDNIGVEIFTITNNNGVKTEIITYGAAIASLFVPDKNGNLSDVVLGYDNIEAYENGNKYIGAVIGRCANRIEHGKFKINDVEYSLAINNGNNHHHGGIKGFDKVVWNVKSADSSENKLELSYLSKDGEESYPGNLQVTVTYTLTEDNALKIDYKAVSDKDTVVNLTNHSYFNLRGHDFEDVLDHKLLINSDEFTEYNQYSIPTGEIINVTGTPMDFRLLKRIGKEIDSDYEQIFFGSGYDHNWLLKSGGNINIAAATLVDEVAGRVMQVYTTKPAMQVYSANFLDGTDIGKGGIPYKRRSAVCLETQYTPNSINNSRFPSPLLKANEEYNHTTIFAFTTI